MNNKTTSLRAELTSIADYLGEPVTHIKTTAGAVYLWEDIPPAIFDKQYDIEWRDTSITQRTYTNLMFAWTKNHVICYEDSPLNTEFSEEMYLAAYPRNPA